jgi:hypothetical protein
MFRTVPLSIIRRFSLTYINGICHTDWLFWQFLCPSSGHFHCTYSNGICHTGWLFGQFLCPSSGDFHLHTAMVYVIQVGCSDSSSVHHQEIFTVHTAMVYVIQVDCWDSSSVHHQEIFTYIQQWYMWYRFAVCKWKSPDDEQTNCPNSQPVWHIPLLYVQWKSPDDGQRNCPKHVAFYSKNKIEKLMHLIGFIIGNLSWCTVKWTSNYSI